MSTKLRWTLTISVLLAAGAVVAWREARRAPTPASAAVQSPQVVMFADLGEENEMAGCGAIIRAVRVASGRGVRTTEVDARNPGDQAKRYRLLISPSVVFFDERGVETGRLEGEAPDTITQMRARLEQLVARK